MDATLCPTPFNKGKTSAMNTLQACDFHGLYQVLGEEDATRSETGERFFAALYGQPLGTTMSKARYREAGKAYVHHGITTDKSKPIISMFS